MFKFKKTLFFLMFIISIIYFSFVFAQMGQHSIQSRKKMQEMSESDVSGRAVVFIDPERVQLLNITTEKISERSLSKIIRTVGVVEVDETKISHIQTKFMGWIEELFVDFIGMQVKKGQPLFSVYSQELFATQEEYLIALKDLDTPVIGRFKEEFKQASMELLKSTHDRLALWDISEEQIKLLKKNKQTTKVMKIYSPCDGIVLDKKAFTGMNVGPGLTTYTIADLSHVWVLADIYEDDVSFIKLGQKAELAIAAYPDKKLKGKVTFVDYVVENSTRTTKVRFEFDNTDYLLKPGMFCNVQFKVKLGKKLALPEEALIDTGERKIVFVSLGNGNFKPKEVKVGYKAGTFYQIIQGLNEGDSVITSAQFLIDSESRLKALEVRGAGKQHSHF